MKYSHLDHKRLAQGNGRKIPTADFPSANCLVWLFTFGAASGLSLAFLPGLSAMQSTNSLVISWFMAVVALMISVLDESVAPDEIFDKPDEIFDE